MKKPNKGHDRQLWRRPRVAISFGIGRLHFVQAVNALAKQDIDLTVIQGWVPSARLTNHTIDLLGKLVGSPHLSVGMGKRRISVIPAERNISLAWPELVTQIASRHGTQCVVASLDVRSDGAGWRCFSRAGTLDTGKDVVTWAKEMEDRGAGEILLTSMDRDGTKAGYNLPLTRAIADAVSIPVIASGGVGTLQHLVEGVTEGHASAVLAASIFHFGTYSIAEAKAYMQAAGIPMRIET